MTTSDRWLLPEGIDEALPEQAAELEYYRRRLLDLYRSWGYAMVVTPFIEYLDSLLIGTSDDLDVQTFKLTDQLNGRLMGIRADMTPQVARIDAHVLKRDVPERLCYFGTVLHTRMDELGGSRSPMQLGAELYGHEGIDSEVEIICLLLETLSSLEVQNVYLDLGHVGVYAGLAGQAGLDHDREYALFDMLQRKACREIDAFLDALDVAPEIRAMLAALSELNGSVEVLGEARAALRHADSGVLATLDYLDQLAVSLRRYHPDLDLHFDLAELRGYHYHTGVVFAAYVPGQGQEIARGGRYDNIGEVFGRARPATGFSADLKVLCEVAAHRGPDERPAVFVAPEDVFAAQGAINSLRAQGQIVVCGLSGQQAGARAMGCSKILNYFDNEWILKDTD